ncbi:Metallo-hydrolase/oxidoreductase [Thozetella sp. PMI_491]|nr:Metallo-hydrolase/oxidoreductase [Thozetella sp. PMI_491]
MSKRPLHARIERSAADRQPAHHTTLSTGSAWFSYLSLWDRPKENPDGAARAGFRNPWPSWYKPTRLELWNALRWSRPGQEEYVKLALSHLPDAQDPDPERLPSFARANDAPGSAAYQAARLLQSEQPDFTFDPSSHRAKVTWLGHASILLQLPPIKDGGKPFCCLFDPIFSWRCSPSRLAGPIRSYAPPCDAQALPPVDIILISHSHYDHLDYDSIMALWEAHKESVRFMVPLGNLPWFVSCGIPADRVTELDWWDAAHLTISPTETTGGATIWCTPAQHSSGRAPTDVNSTLWASWYIVTSGSSPYRAFFAGDSGYQFHESPDWPPSPSSGIPDKIETDTDEKFPVCPAFAEIATRIGTPDLFLLPVSVGATYSYLRSFAYVPDSINPLPYINPGYTAVTHMPPWDAVRVLRTMIENSSRGDNSDPPVAIGVHWGTFVVDPTEVLMTLGQLEWACQQQGVAFARSVESGEINEKQEACFLALNQGQSVEL